MSQVPNKLDPKKRRVSYAEEIEVLDEIKAVMAETGQSQTDIIREAVAEFLDRKKRDAAAEAEEAGAAEEAEAATEAEGAQ